MKAKYKQNKNQQEYSVLLKVTLDKGFSVILYDSATEAAA